MVEREPLVAILPIEHRLSTRSGVTLRDLASYPMVLGSIGEWEFFRTFVMDIFAQAGEQVTVRYEASNAMGILGLVASGLGVSVYSGAIERFQPRSIMTRPISDCAARVETALVWNRAYTSPALHNFVRVARQMVAGQGAAR